MSLTGYATTLTEAQSKGLLELKALLSKQENSVYKEFCENRRDCKNDVFVLRFLRATMSNKGTSRDFQPNEAFDRLKSSIDFRIAAQNALEKEGIDPKGLITNSKDLDQIPKDNSLDFAERWHRYLKNKPNYRYEDSLENSLVMIERFGVVGTKLDPKAFTEEELNVFTYILLQSVEEDLFDVYSKNLEVDDQSIFDGFVGIIDLKHVGRGLIAPARIKVIKHLNDITGLHFPELVKKYYFVNSPMQFLVNGLLSVVKKFLDKNTTQKFVFLSKGQQPELDLKLLPKEFGGENNEEVPKSTL
eukprot:maker-scaffold_7-snap-gene-8.55-mRNA-1 protein AED:0.00 eAED:0.00 QI:118/1/1/1/1/1/2/137/301